MVKSKAEVNIVDSDIKAKGRRIMWDYLFFAVVDRRVCTFTDEEMFLDGLPLESGAAKH